MNIRRRHFLMLLATVAMLTGCNLKSDLKEKYKTEEVVSYDNYQDALRANDFEAAHELLEGMQGKPDYEKAYDEVFNAEALYLCANGDKSSLDRVVFLLSSVPIEGTPVPEGTAFKDRYDMRKMEDGHNLYIRSVTKYNQKCSMLIDLAISKHNEGLAERIMPLFKAVPMSLENVSDSVQTMQYSWADRDRAKEKMNNQNE